MSHAELRDLHVLGGWKKTDGNVTLLDQRFQKLLVTDIEWHGCTFGVAFDETLRFADRARRDRNLELRFLQEVVYQRARHQAGSENEDLVHAHTPFDPRNWAI
jgi:hypothetical protein